MNPSRPDSMLSRPPLAARLSSENLEQLCYGSIRKSPFHREQQQSRVVVAAVKPAATTPAPTMKTKRSFIVEMPDSCVRKDDDNNSNKNNNNHVDDSESTTSMSTLSWNGDHGSGLYSPFSQRGKMIRSTEPHRPSGVVVAARSPDAVAKKAAYSSSTSKNNNNKPIKNLPWLQNEDVSKKAVFQIHLKRPAIRIQAAVRGMLARIRYQQQQLLPIVDTKYGGHPSASIIAIQAAMRGKLERLRFQKFCKDLLEEYYATNIQKWFRGARLRRGIRRHESAMILQDALRDWMPRAKEYRIQLVHREIDLEHAHRLEMNKISAHKQREMKRIRKQVAQELKAAKPSGVKVPPTEHELLLDAQVSEIYQMVKYLYDEQEELQNKQRKLHQDIGHQLDEYEKEIQNKEQIECDIETLQNDIVPHLEHNVKVGQRVENEWVEHIEQTEESIFQFSLRTLTEKRMSTITHETMNAIVEFMDQHNGGGGSGDDDDNLIASIYKMAFQVEFENDTKRCNLEQQLETS